MFLTENIFINRKDWTSTGSINSIRFFIKYNTLRYFKKYKPDIYKKINSENIMFYYNYEYGLENMSIITDPVKILYIYKVGSKEQVLTNDISRNLINLFSPNNVSKYFNDKSYSKCYDGIIIKNDKIFVKFKPNTYFRKSDSSIGVYDNWIKEFPDTYTMDI